MTQSFATQSSNFVSTLQTRVDPRTGQFLVNLPIAKLVGNHQLGPEFSLGLSYSPLNTKNSGFGNGFSLGVTQFNRGTNQLELSNGETYRVAPGTDTVRNKKLDNFRFVYTNGNDDTKGYTVFWKEGKHEQLTIIGSDTFVTSTITSPLGRKMNFFWDWSGQSPLLTKITDERTTLCEISYRYIVKMTVWPDTNEACNLEFRIINGDQLDAVSRKISDTETMDWFFSYDLEEKTMKRLLTKVRYPTGKFDQVTYSEALGLRFPEKSRMKYRLPAVLSHTSNPGSGQLETVTYYEYTAQNFLGYNSNFGDWSADSDYLYTTLTDYEYGSTETVSDGDTKVTVNRTYNNYHLQTSEEKVCQNCKYHISFTYYAQKGAFIESQPRQFQLPREKKETWTDEKGNSRTQSTLTEFDESGNPMRQVSPDGTETITSWYPAKGGVGCPAEPNKFVRFMKKVEVMPRKTDYDAPIMTTEYQYKTLDGEKKHVVQDRVSNYANGVLIHRRNFSYSSGRDDFQYGRIVSISDSKYEEGEMSAPFTSHQNFITVVKDGTMNQTTTFTGCDNIQMKTARMQSVISGLLLSETNIQGLITTHTYDQLGRPLKRTVASGTDYEEITTWAYAIEKTQNTSICVTTQTDSSGNKLRLIFDGAGRNIRIERMEDAGTHRWLEIFSQTFDVFGDIKKQTNIDWHMDLNHHYSVDTIFSRDAWGSINTQAFSDGTKTFNTLKPVSLTQSIHSEGEKNGQHLRGGMISKSFDQQSRLPLSESLQDVTGTELGRRLFEWDGAGRLRKETDELGNVTKRTYDVYGRVLTQVLPDGTVVSRAYAPHLTGDQISSISVTGQDAQGQTKTWILGTQEFDSLGRVTKRVCGGRVTSYEYEGASPAVSAITLPSGEKVFCTHTPELGNKVSTLTTPTINRTFSYDKKTGELLTAKESNVKIKNTWSKSGHLTEENFSYGDKSKSSGSIYTLNGKCVSYTDVAGGRTQYTMDSLGTVTRITDNALTVDLAYDPLGRLIERIVKDNASSSSQTTTFAYDEMSRELMRTIKDDRGMILQVSQTWEKNGLLETRVTKKNGTTLRQEKYKYDNRNRLIDYNVSGSQPPADSYGFSMTSQIYSYDALNNLTEVKTILTDNSTDMATYFYKNNDDPTQLTEVTHTHKGYPKQLNLIYDKEGRMIRDEAGRTLTYDVTGRLVGVIGANGQSGTYSYDALDRLITRNANKTDTRDFYYRGDEVVNEIASSKDKGARFIKLGHTSVGLSDDSGLTLTTGDHNDSLLWSVDTSKTSKEGNIHIWAPYGSGVNDDRLPGFNGEHIDPVSGTYHLGNGYRAYNPVLMRFNCPDSLSPFGAGGINPYAYCAGDPVNHVDPSGHLSWEAIAGITMGVIGLGLAAFTAGASIAACGGVIAALNSASATSLIVGGLGVLSDITAIASGALEDSRPEASSTLGWVSLATGFAGLAVSLGKGVGKMGRNVFHNSPRDKFVHYSGDVFPNLQAPTIAERGNRPTTWYRHAFTDAEGSISYKYGADTRIKGADIMEPLRELRSLPDRKETVIFSNTHGNRYGKNWVRRYDGRNSTITRDLGQYDRGFYQEDRLDYGWRPRVTVVSPFKTSWEEFQAYLKGDYHVILGFCYGRNDEGFRYLLGLGPVTSYV